MGLIRIPEMELRPEGLGGRARPLPFTLSAHLKAENGKTPARKQKEHKVCLGDGNGGRREDKRANLGQFKIWHHLEMMLDNKYTKINKTTTYE